MTTKFNREVLEANGFRLSTKGDKVLDDQGKQVSAEIADLANRGLISLNINLDELKKNKPKAGSKVDLLAELKKIAPAIPLLKPGMSAKVFYDPKDYKGEDGTKDPKRSIVMSLTSKLTNLTYKGKEWEGRVYELLHSDTDNFVHVVRNNDLPEDEIRVRKSGGGRPKKNTGVPDIQEALNKSREHMNGGGEQEETQKEPEISDEPVVIPATA